jgi:hypothetical protein
MPQDKASDSDAKVDQLDLSTPSRHPPFEIIVRLPPARTTPVFDSYWRLAAERQEIFFRRLEGHSPPWTKDPILLQYKFTNAYRASDRVSQFLIREIIYTGEQDFVEIFFRTILFKLFNKIETWRRLVAELGILSWSTFDSDRYDAVLEGMMRSGESIYSAAYIMPSGGRGAEPERKHRMHLRLLARMMKEEVPTKIADCRRMQDAFELLRAYPTFGDFLAYQYVTDLNYSAALSFSEREFVVPGPGARDGIRKCFSDAGGLNEAELIRLCADRQEEAFAELGIDFRSLWGRPLQLIDCQNLFCETDKYARVRHPEYSGRSGRTRIKQRFQSKGEPLLCFYPPKWGINEFIPLSHRAAPEAAQSEDG